MNYYSSPFREYAIIAAVSALLGGSFLLPQIGSILFTAALLGSLPTFWNALRSLSKFRISIDVFNAFALAVAFGLGETQSVAFIALMLAFASLLDWHTETRARKAVEELLKLKPLKAFCEVNGEINEVSIEKIKTGDTLLVKNGSRVPVDGIIVFGSASINESSVTGESIPVEREIGDRALSSTLVESGVIKIKATAVGEDSTIERMAALIKKASEHKSHQEKLADTFAGLFLPIILLSGIILYAVTRSASMLAAWFLVACADDVAVAIPLAMTAALGRAAKRGVIIKGGEWLDTLHKVSLCIFDKTGTLTYGSLNVASVYIEKGIREDEFWKVIAIAEKFSEHPIGRALFKEGFARAGEALDPDEFYAQKGRGVWAKKGHDEIVAGNKAFFSEKGINLPDLIKKESEEYGETLVLVARGGSFIGSIRLSDVPRRGAKKSIETLKNLGIRDIMIFTGDRERVAGKVARALGITSFRAEMTPEKKFREVEELSKTHVVAMVGDGINDSPALARADVGIAMGKAGTAIAVEAADIVVLNDDLSRIPEIMLLSRRTLSIIKGDIVIWIFSNIVGFALVLTGVAGPAFAAFYNFATDFLPLLNSARLFRK